MITAQFDTKRDSDGWTVFDRFTGKAVVLARSHKMGLSYADADDLAQRLNRRRLFGDRSILQ